MTESPGQRLEGHVHGLNLLPSTLRRGFLSSPPPAFAIHGPPHQRLPPLRLGSLRGLQRGNWRVRRKSQWQCPPEVALGLAWLPVGGATVCGGRPLLHAPGSQHRGRPAACDHTNRLETLRLETLDLAWILPLCKPRVLQRSKRIHSADHCKCSKPEWKKPRARLHCHIHFYELGDPEVIHRTFLESCVTQRRTNDPESSGRVRDGECRSAEGCSR